MLLKEVEKDNMTQNEGWVCPKCKVSICPQEKMCPECKKEKMNEFYSEDKQILMG